MSASSAKRLTAALLLTALGLGVLLWVQSPVHLSAAERHLVGIWRRYNAEGQPAEDVWYKPDRTVAFRKLNCNEWALFPSKNYRWRVRAGQIEWSERISVAKKLFGSSLRRIAQNSFNLEAARRSGCKSSLKRMWIGVWLSKIPVSYDCRSAHTNRMIVPATKYREKQTLVRIALNSPPIDATVTEDVTSQ